MLTLLSIDSIGSPDPGTVNAFLFKTGQSAWRPSEDSWWGSLRGRKASFSKKNGEGDQKANFLVTLTLHLLGSCSDV